VDGNLTEGFEAELMGSDFDLHNLATVTLTGYSQHAWSGKRFYCVGVSHERNAKHTGRGRSTYRFREAPA
jgi:hypothetical protein